MMIGCSRELEKEVIDMAKLNELYRVLEKNAPIDLCEEWDNSGILINSEKDIINVLITLDITIEVVEEAVNKNCQLIISHHPVIFKPIYKIEKKDVVYKLISNDISVISMHTNLDKADGGVNDILAAKLELCETKKFADIGRQGELKKSMAVREFAKIVSKQLNTPIKCSLPDRIIKNVAVIGGSGGAYWKEVCNQHIDALLTGEASYHDVLDAKNLNIPVILAGHWNTENLVVEEMQKNMGKLFPKIGFVKSEANVALFRYVFNN